VNSLDSKSEDDGCQQIILKDRIEVGELITSTYHNDSLLENAVQTIFAICAEKDADGIFELVQQDKQLVGIGGNDKIRKSSEFGRKPESW